MLDSPSTPRSEQTGEPASAVRTRRSFLWAAGAGAALAACGQASPSHRLATFSADVTVPLGHGLLAGVIEPAREIVDPLAANGLVLWSDGEAPVVIVGVDWAEIRNDAHERWRRALAEAAGTTPERVLVSSLHQHDAPVMDLEAQRLLDSQGLHGLLCDAEFHEQALRRVAQALRESLPRARPITRIGVGQARVEQVASNRRIETPDGVVSFDRSAIVADPAVQALPEGLIDPFLKTVSFWDGEQAVAALSCFAVHPITEYGRGRVSWDYVGLARQRRQQEDPAVRQIYLTGCAGDVTAGKYTDGDPARRPVLAERLYEAMRSAGRRPSCIRWIGSAAAAFRSTCRCAPRRASLARINKPNHRRLARYRHPRAGGAGPELVEARRRRPAAGCPRRRARPGPAAAAAR